MWLSSLSIFSPLLFPEFYFLWLLQSGRRWHTQSCNFRCLITTCVLQICMGRDLINAVVARWLDGKCQRLLATALKVQHCWTLKTTVGDCWRQSPTCAGDSRKLKYKNARDCRRLSPSRATVGDWSINQALSNCKIFFITVWPNSMMPLKCVIGLKYHWLRLWFITRKLLAGWEIYIFENVVGKVSTILLKPHCHVIMWWPHYKLTSLAHHGV